MPTGRTSLARARPGGIRSRSLNPGESTSWFQSLGITGTSKSEVSRICAALDAEIGVFRSRPLVFLDATYLEVRKAGRVVSMAALVATGLP
jgi:transposase-like protein